MKKPTGGTAFPYEYTYQGTYGESREIEEGLTKRDYFAIKCVPFFLDKMQQHDYGIVAEQAYLMADKMLQEREYDR